MHPLSNNAQLTGDLLTYVGSANGENDGAGVRINGTFGPGTPIKFNYTEITPSISDFDSVGFTVGVSVPEPSTFVVGFVGALGMITYGWRRRKGGNRAEMGEVAV